MSDPSDVRANSRIAWTVKKGFNQTWDAISCGAMLRCADALEKILSQCGHVLHRIDNKLTILLDHAKRNARPKKRRKAKPKRRAKR